MQINQNIFNEIKYYNPSDAELLMPQINPETGFNPTDFDVIYAIVTGAYEAKPQPHETTLDYENRINTALDEVQLAVIDDDSILYEGLKAYIEANQLSLQLYTIDDLAYSRISLSKTDFEESALYRTHFFITYDSNYNPINTDLFDPNLVNSNKINQTDFLKFINEDL